MATNTKAKKQRLDKLLVSRGLVESREKAKALILAGKVIVGEHRVDKAGTMFFPDVSIRLKAPPMKYVSRGGLKLEAALEAFDVQIKDTKALDVGASTGGFTDCLLQHGCDHVTAVDVGYGQLHNKLRQEPRVLSLERTNARYLTREILQLE
ncbi:MAG TPA: TlyA family rRNA (cytidine-2'-O)-methyltransferase, partial [Myxococcales bacterium]|nr:TlyA family rRNA (cytidine-2'-O)-methyltransferase [Myxococcales bacterium]